jgi:hypothetical protein
MSLDSPLLPTCALHKVGRLARVLRTCPSCYRHSRSWPDPDSASIIGGSLSISGPVAVIRLRASRAANKFNTREPTSRLFPTTGNSTLVELAADPVFGTPRTAPPGGASMASVDREAHDNDKISQQLLNVERDAWRVWLTTVDNTGRRLSQTLEHASRRSHCSEYPDDYVTQPRPRPRSPSATPTKSASSFQQ